MCKIAALGPPCEKASENLLKIIRFIVFPETGSAEEQNPFIKPVVYDYFWRRFHGGVGSLIKPVVYADFWRHFGGGVKQGGGAGPKIKNNKMIGPLSDLSTHCPKVKINKMNVK